MINPCSQKLDTSLLDLLVDKFSFYTREMADIYVKMVHYRKKFISQLSVTSPPKDNGSQIEKVLHMQNSIIMNLISNYESLTGTTKDLRSEFSKLMSPKEPQKRKIDDLLLSKDSGIRFSITFDKSFYDESLNRLTKESEGNIKTPNFQDNDRVYKYEDSTDKSFQSNNPLNTRKTMCRSVDFKKQEKGIEKPKKGKLKVSPSRQIPTTSKERLKKEKELLIDCEADTNREFPWVEDKKAKAKKKAPLIHLSALKYV